MEMTLLILAHEPEQDQVNISPHEILLNEECITNKINYYYYYEKNVPPQSGGDNPLLGTWFMDST